MQRRVGITTIYVTHDQEEALAIADRVVLMNAGRVVQSGVPEDVYRGPPASSPPTSWVWALGSRDARSLASCTWPGSACSTTGPRAGSVVVVLRSSDVALGPPTAGADGSALAGHVEERLFLGAFYRHYVRVGDTC